MREPTEEEPTPGWTTALLCLGPAIVVLLAVTSALNGDDLAASGFGVAAVVGLVGIATRHLRR